MMILFKSSRCVAGKDYKKGVHDVPKEALKDPYFLKLVELGEVFEAPQAPKKEDTKARSESLKKKLEAEAEEEETEAEEAESEDSEESEEEPEEDEDFLEEPKKKAKKKKKSGRK